MKIVRFLKNKNLARRIENTPRETSMRMYFKGKKPKKSRKRKAASEPVLGPEPEPQSEPQPEPALEDFEQEIEIRKKYPNEDTPIPPELELIPDGGSPNDNVFHLYNEYYIIPNYKN